MNITVVGVGLLGGSFALIAREKGLAAKITGVDINPVHAERALS
jgi:prephenate dehydrogenase